MDSSGYLAAQGFSVSVAFDLASLPDADVVAVSTESRHVSAAIAAEKAWMAARAITPRLVYKKIDSTLRGNVGAELAAVMDEMGFEKAIVAPAFPSAGRTIVDGTLLVDGIPITETPFARDPTDPVRESHVPTLLATSIRFDVGHVGLETIDTGSDGITRHLRGRSEKVLVCDATQQDHLRATAQASIAEERWLLCGSGGLARELGTLLTRESRHHVVESGPRRIGPALLVVGSTHPTSAAQLSEVRSEKGIPMLRPGIESPDRVVQGNGSVAITSVLDPYVLGTEATVAEALVDAVVRAVRGGPAGLLLCGGEIAAQVCRRLAVRAIQLVGEIEAGVPAAVISGGDADGVRLVTKAGGFGSRGAMVASLSYLEEGVLPDSPLSI